MEKAEKFILKADDGVDIGATVFQHRQKSPHLIILGPATGAPQHYYRKFAEFASGNFEFDAVTFDYRGVGDSLTGPIKKDKSRMSDWGQYDLKAIIDWADKRYDKIFLLGHSVSGQLFPKAENRDRISAAYFVGSQTAYYGYWLGWPWIQVSIFWYLSIPLTTLFMGYMPGWAMGGKVSLPKGVAREWRKWGTHPNGVLQDNPQTVAQFNSVKAPIHFVSIEDDKLMAPTAATKELMHYYGNAKTSFQFIRPKDLGVKAIGHFGFFKSRHQEKLWSMPILYFTQFVKKLG